MGSELETCSNCGVDVDKDPTVLCDECEGDSEAATLRAENERLKGALQKIANGNPGTPDHWLWGSEMARLARRALEETP